MKINFIFNIFIFSLLVLIGCKEQKTSPNPIPQATEFKPADLIDTRRMHGQSVYVPIYSSIYHQFEDNLFHLTAILSIRNISPTNGIIISEVSYYDTNGKFLRNFINGPFTLGKMASKDFVIPESDLSGGTGANFIVKWESEYKVAAPLIEAVMIGTQGTKGFSFTSRGKEIEAH